MYLPPKSCSNFTEWFKKGRNWNIVITYLNQCRSYMLTLQALVYIGGINRTKGLIWNYARGTLTLWKPESVIIINCGEVRTHGSCEKP